MTSVKSLAAWFNIHKCRLAPTGVYLKRFGHQEEDICWWYCGGGRRAAPMRGNLFRHCSWWRDQQKALWNAVGKPRGWTACRHRLVQISELGYIKECNQVVMDFPAATEVGNFPPKWMTARCRCRCRGWLRRGGWRQWNLYPLFFLALFFPLLLVRSMSFSFCLSLNFQMWAGMKGSGEGALPSSRLARRRRGY